MGKSVIQSDPNEISENGKALLNLIERENLCLQNISPKCNGVIKRQGITKKGVEKAVFNL